MFLSSARGAEERDSVSCLSARRGTMGTVFIAPARAAERKRQCFQPQRVARKILTLDSSFSAWRGSKIAENILSARAAEARLRKIFSQREPLMFL